MYIITSQSPNMDGVVWQKIVWCLLLVPLLSSAQTYCPDGWIHHDEGCYLLHTEKANWYEAETLCTGHNARLAVVTDAAENMFIKGLILNAFGGDHKAHVWLGATDDVIEGQFLWLGTDAKLNYTDWGPNEPNAVPLHLDEDCLVYWAQYNWKWADLDCHQECYSVCEKV